MKKIFLSIATFISFIAYGQTPPGWTKINFSYNYVGVGADNNMIAPRYSGFPTFRGGYLGSGQIGVDTVNHIFYFASGGIWRAGTTQWTSVGSDIYYNSGGVAIGNTSVNSKAILDLTSTSKGMLTPRMNTAQMNAISSVPTGLLIYNTDSAAFVYYNGTAWRKIGTGSGGVADGRGNDSIQFRDEGVALGTRGSVKTINYFGQSIAATRWTDSITVFGSSNYNSFQRNNTIINQNYYDAFPSVAWDQNTLATAAVVWKSAGNHVAAGNALISYSHDGFSTFTTPDTIKLVSTNLTTANTISIGRGNGYRWNIQWNYTVTNAIHFAYNDQEDETFSADDSLVVSGWNWVFPFGSIIQVHGDTLFAPIYGVENGHTQGSVAYIKSYNNGNSWSYGGLIFYGFSQDANSNPSELDWAIISGTQVSDTKILAVCRDDYYKGYHHEITSSNGGSTWTEHVISESQWAFGPTNAGFTVDNSWPCNLIKRGDYLYAVMGVRSAQDNGGFSLRVFKGKATDVFTTATNWDLKFTTPYRALSFYYGGGDKDFGYHVPYLTPSGEIKAIFYDKEPRSNEAASVNINNENIKAIPITDNNYYEAFNDANQSITTGTETTVTFPDPFLDGQRYYNSDSSKIYATQDGWYEISAQFLADTSGLGTYRQAKIKIIVGGQEWNGSVHASRTISQVTYQPSSDFKFCWFELHAQAFIRMGEEIRVTFKHDKGSSLNILNSVTDIEADGARIKIKKID